MSRKIGFTNEFQPESLLREIAKDKRVAEIEGEGMDPGRVFVHLVPGYYVEGYGTRSFGAGLCLGYDTRNMTRKQIEEENQQDMAYRMSLVKRGKGG